jgi:hypothetical protein
MGPRISSTPAGQGMGLHVHQWNLPSHPAGAVGTGPPACACAQAQVRLRAALLVFLFAFKYKGLAGGRPWSFSDFRDLSLSALAALPLGDGKKTYFRKTGSHLPLSEESGLIVRPFTVSLFSYLLKRLKLELMAGLASRLLVRPSGGSCSNLGLIKDSTKPPPHSNTQLEAQECTAHSSKAWLHQTCRSALKPTPWAPTHITVSLTLQAPAVATQHRASLVAPA